MVTSAGAVLVENKSLPLIAAVVTAVCTMKRALKLYRSKSLLAAKLHELVKSGTVDQVRESLERHPENVNHQDRWKRTPLFRAHNVQVARLLIDRGADVNHENEKKETPLLCAASKGFIYVVQLLIDGRANVNQVDRNGLTPLFDAATNRHLECARLLLKSGANIPFTVNQSEAVKIRSDAGIIQLLEAENILTASSEVGANSSVIYRLIESGLLLRRRM